MSSPGQVTTWAVSAATVGAILVRPRGIPEWCWALLGASVLIAVGALTPGGAANAVWSGLDVYLFLAGMLALAELARVEGVFDWLAAAVVPRAGNSQRRLFAWVYAVGVLVTVLLSNDATVLLLTPAVLAAVRHAGVRPLPFLYACAFVANAASFVLPISNPANLVVFERLPALGPWLTAFWLPSLAAVLCTFAALWMLFRRAFREPLAATAASPVLGRTGLAAAILVGASAALIAIAAAFGRPVGLTAFILGGASLLAVALLDSGSTRAVLKQAPWSIIPLVAGLFVIVGALDRSGVLGLSRTFFKYAGSLHAREGSALTGWAIALADNVLNNLPVGVLARYSLRGGGIPPHIAHAALVGVDLGPNLSVTGSLATLLWLLTLRRENVAVTPWQFMRLGILVTLPALALALLVVR